MKRTMTFWIDTRIARRHGVRAAAVAGYLFAHVRRAALEVGARDGEGRGWVRVSQEQIAQQLHLCRQTVAKILRTLTDAGILVAANFYTDAEGSEHIIEASSALKGKARAACHLAKANRGYTMGDAGFRMMGLKPRQWHVWHEEALMCSAINTGVCAKVGINAAIVFQYLWHWSRAWRWSSRYIKGDRVWQPYTAAVLSRWLPFLSDDVIGDALHVLEREGLLLKLREGCLTKWAIGDGGFRAMGEMPPLQVIPAHQCEEERNRYLKSVFFPYPTPPLLFPHTSLRANEPHSKDECL